MVGNQGKTEPDRLAKAVAEKLFSVDSTSSLWDFALQDVGEGWAQVSMVVRPDMLNGLGTAHGGSIFALADTAFAYACNSRNVRTFAQHASISFLNAAQGGEQLVADAREESAEGRTGVYTVKVSGEDGRIIAVFQGLSRTAGGAIVDDLDNKED